MSDAKQYVFLSIVVLLVGCGEREETASPRNQLRDIDTEQPETTSPNLDATPWETPDRLVLFAAQKIEDTEEKVDAFLKIASSQVEAGDKEQALITLKQAVDSAQKLENERRQVLALKNIVIALAETGEIKQAIKLSQIIEDPFYEVSLLLGATSALTKKGDKKLASTILKEAIEVTHKIDNAVRKTLVLCSIASAQADAGDKKQAFATLQQATNVAQMIKDASRLASTQRHFALAFAKVGDKKRAVEIAQNIKDAGSKQFLLTDIALILADSGQIEEAENVAQTIEDAGLPKISVLVLFKIALSQAATGDKDRALNIMSRALAVAHKIDDAEEKASALGGVASTLAVVGDIEQALEIAQEIVDARLEESVLMNRDIAMAQIAAGDKERALVTLNQALKAIRKTEDTRQKDYARLVIAPALAKTEEFTQSIDVAQQIQNADNKVEALLKIASSQIEAGQKEMALTTIKQSMNSAQLISTVHGMTHALLEIAMLLATDPKRNRTKKHALGFGRIKKAFTPEEKQLARQLAEAIQEN